MIEKTIVKGRRKGEIEGTRKLENKRPNGHVVELLHSNSLGQDFEGNS